MLYNNVAVKANTAKEAEGNLSEPLDHGVFMNGYNCSDSGTSHSKAVLTPQRLFSANIGKYHLL